MAWIWLIVVIIVFYLPVLFGYSVISVTEDLVLSFPGLSVSMPFSGALKFILATISAWLVLWGFTKIIEKATHQSMLSHLDRTWPTLALRERWLYATRPTLALRLPIWLARIGVIAGFVKLVGVIGSAFLAYIVIPWLVGQAFSALIGWLLGISGGGTGGFLSVLAFIIVGSVTYLLVGPLVDGLKLILGLSDIVKISPYLFGLSLLILLADGVFSDERAAEWEQEIKVNQERRKREQQEIVIPR